MLSSREPLFSGKASPAPAAATGAADVALPPPTIEIPQVAVKTDAASGTAAPKPTVVVDDTRFAEVQRRATDLERDNADLTQQLAVASQKTQTLQDQVSLLQAKLGETVSQLRDTQVSRDEADRRAQAILASAQKNGASFTANNSVKQSLSMIDLPGLDVRQDGDVIRIAIPSDKLFQPASVEWVAGSNTLLDQAALAISRNYPRQRVVIEAHTDSSIIGLPGGSQQLCASQALAVYQHLVARNQIPAKQLVTSALGPSFPRASNATDEGRQQNRRIELVVYPEELR
ncbi:MAG: OmpA family protein [Planctomycetales bacterium]|nr:OmpA family protein [Planctomycetales bacterium]